MDSQTFQEILSKAREVYLDENSSKSDDITDDITNVNIEQYQLRPKARELFDFLEHLSFDDLIDLCAYADYGREHLLAKAMSPNQEEYISKRAAFFASHRDSSERKGLVCYLISKRSRLYLYLDYAKPLIDNFFKK